jgi:two-component system, OmpR family, KDP operon response regulator KdpE
MKVLVVDDDQRIREALEIGVQLQWQDATVLTAADGETGLSIFYDEEPDIVLLDVMMPRKNGFEVLRAIRQVSDVPVIILTGRDEDVDQVRGLELGADDYIGKPYSHLALMARIKASLRRAELPAPVQALPDFEAGDLAIHFQNHEVTVRGEAVKLTPVEYKLLYHLVRNTGHLPPHEALLDRVWGSKYEASPEYLKVLCRRQRGLALRGTIEWNEDLLEHGPTIEASRCGLGGER